MSRNLPGTPSYAMRESERPSPRKTIPMPRDFWAELEAEALRRGVALAAWLREAASAHLPTSRELPADGSEASREKST